MLCLGRVLSDKDVQKAARKAIWSSIKFIFLGQNDQTDQNTKKVQIELKD